MPHPADTVPWHLYNDYLSYDIFVDNLITVSEANKTGEHWTKKSKRHQNQKTVLQDSLKFYHVNVKMPAHITLCRYNSHFLDDDNLVSAFKYIRDALCDYLMPGLAAGRADARLDITFSYQQVKSKRKGTQIQIYEKKDEL
jgi:hypothetical protein